MVMSGTISPPLLETVARRASLIECLLEGPADKRELESTLDVSRTTVDRAVRRLSDAECITRQDGRWEVTLLGRLAYEEYERLTVRYEGLTTAQTLLSHLPPRTPVDGRLLVDAELLLAEPPAPHMPTARLEELLNGSDQIQGVSSVVLPRYIPLFHDRTIERDTKTDLVLESELVEYLWDDHAEKTRAVIESDNGAVWCLDQELPFGFVLIDEDTVWFAVYDEDGCLKGTIINDSPAAVTWATDMFHSYRQQAEQVSVRSQSGVTSSRR